MRPFLRYWLPVLLWIVVIFIGFERSDVGGTYLASSCPTPALVETGHHCGSDCPNSFPVAEMRASNGVRDSRDSSSSCTVPRHEFACEAVGFLYGDLVCVRNFYGQRRISSIVRTIAHGVAERRADRHQRRVFWAGGLFGGRAKAEIPGKDEFGLKVVAARTPHQIAAATAPQSKIRNRKSKMKMGLTGLEPVTLRLSSACSNQLSYRPSKQTI